MPSRTQCFHNPDLQVYQVFLWHHYYINYKDEGYFSSVDAVEKRKEAQLK